MWSTFSEPQEKMTWKTILWVPKVTPNSAAWVGGKGMKTYGRWEVHSAPIFTLWGINSITQDHWTLIQPVDRPPFPQMEEQGGASFHINMLRVRKTQLVP